MRRLAFDAIREAHGLAIETGPAANLAPGNRLPDDARPASCAPERDPDCALAPARGLLLGLLLGGALWLGCGVLALLIWL